VRLRVGKSEFLEAEQINVGRFPLWVRKDPRGKHWDVDVTRPILEGDEYELEPLIASNHQLHWVLDIGAHIGSFTLKIKGHWPEAKIIAAEPDPDNAALFRKNTEDLEDVFLHEAAVLGSGRWRRAHLRQAGRANQDHNAAASNVAEAVEPFDADVAPPTVTVDATGIVDLLAKYGAPVIDLLKLDCEGAEGAILEALDAAGLMKRVGWIRGEWHYFENIPRIEAALEKTHTYSFHRGHTPWGAFIAHRNLEEWN
jgi:FkbM family methyltransferase